VSGAASFALTAGKRTVDLLENEEGYYSFNQDENQEGRSSLDVQRNGLRGRCRFRPASWRAIISRNFEKVPDKNAVALYSKRDSLSYPASPIL